MTSGRAGRSRGVGADGFAVVCVCGFVLFGLSLSVCVGRCLGPVSVSLGPGLALGGLPSFAFKEILDVTLTSWDLPPSAGTSGRTTRRATAL